MRNGEVSWRGIDLEKKRGAIWPENRDPEQKAWDQQAELVMKGLKTRRR